jgi:hypothetical protein
MVKKDQLGQAGLIDRLEDPMGNIFLSYSRKDKGIVERLKNRLEAAGHYVWIDIEGIRGGDQWRRAIAEAIRQADTFVLLLSSNAVKSDNVCKELNLAEENKSRVIPVAISSVAIPPEMQYQLAGVQRIDLATDFEHGLKQLLEALGGSDVPVAGDQAVSTSGQGPSPLAASPGPPPLPAAPVPKQGKGSWLRTGLFVIALVITVGAIGYLVVQRGLDGIKGTPVAEEIPVTQPSPITVTPSNTPTDTPTGTPTPTSTAIATTTATPTATPGCATSGIIPDGRFKEIWQGFVAGDSHLGCATSPEYSKCNFAEQRFEKGVMYWWQNTDGQSDIWVIDSPAADFKSGKNWTEFKDEWKGQPDNCEAHRENGVKWLEKGGFSWLWCQEELEVKTRLGNPVEPRAGNNDEPPYSHVQSFDGGVMLYNPIEAWVYVLFKGNGWQRFEW